MAKKPTYEELEQRVKTLEKEAVERKRAEEALRESEKRYRLFVEQSAEGIWRFESEKPIPITLPEDEQIELFYAFGYLAECNDVMAHMYGFDSKEEIIGARLGDLLIRSDPHNTEYLRSFIRSNYRLTDAESHELDREGNTHIFLNNFIGIIEGGNLIRAWGTQRNITEQKRIEKALRKNEERYKELADSLPQIVFEIDERCNITFTNRIAFDLFGYTKKDLDKGLNVLQMLIPEDRDRAMENIRRVLNGETLGGIEYTAQRKDGITFPVLIHSNPIIRENKPVGLRGIIIDLTEQKRIEEILRASEERYRALFDQAADSIVLIDTETGALVEFNKRAHETLGFTPEEFKKLKKHDFEVIESAEEVTKHIKKIIEEGPDTFETKHRTKSGEIRDIQVSCRAISIQGKNFIQSMWRDISQLKRVEEELRKSEEKYRTLVENINDVIFTVDTQGCILYISPVVEKMTKYKVAEVMGKPFMPLVHPEDLPGLIACFERTLSGQIEPYEFRIFDKDGSIRHVRSSSRLLFENDQLVGLTGVITDITDQKRMEEELIIAQKLESIGTLAGGIAHDFNNLLTAIWGYIDISQIYAQPGSKLSKNLSEAEKACMRARELTQQLITFSKGGAPMKQTGSLMKLIKNSVNLGLSGSNVRCEFSISDDLWLVEFDEAQIKQVITNLITNANEAMPEGGIIKVSAQNLAIGEEKTEPFMAIPQGRYVKISIQDQGTGIPEEHLSKIFDPYFSTKERGAQKGMGLGLATAYSIIKKHDGNIHVESKVGFGTTVQVFLPVSEGEIPEKRGKGERDLVEKGKILVMDDEEIVRDVAGQMLYCLGYEVEFAEDGIEAIDRYKKAKETGQPFNVVILDLTVRGGMGGKEAIRRLIEIDPGIKGIVASGYSNDPVLTNFSEYGFLGAITKPYNMDELRKAIQAVIA